MAQPPVAQFSGIFVSYRRDDSSGHAGRLFDNLAKHFGEDQIFMDIDTIEPGEDFVELIEKAVGSCEIVIAVIGQRWLSSLDGETRRLDNPNDFVRLEIATTLKRSIRLIPVLVQKATMPRLQDLPEEIAALSRRNAIEISDSRWQYDVAKLITVLEKVLAARREARAAEARQAEEERQLQEAAETQRAEEEPRRLAEEEEKRRTAEEKRQEEERERKTQEETQRAEEELKRMHALEEAHRSERATQERLAEEVKQRAEKEESTLFRAKADKEAEGRRLETKKQARAEKERIGLEAEADARQHDVDQGLHGSREEKSTMPDAPAVAPPASSETAPQMPDSLTMDDSTRVIIIVCVVLAIIAFLWMLSAN